MNIISGCGHEPPVFGCGSCIARREGWSIASTFGMTRVNLSLPCTVPVSPETPDTEADIQERAEKCNVDAFWVMGVAHICDVHLVQLFGEADYRILCTEFEREAGWPMEQERERHAVPWTERHRYPQEQAVKL